MPGSGLAKDLGVELEIVQVTGPNRVPFLMTGKADMMIATFSITPERAKVITFASLRRIAICRGRAKRHCNQEPGRPERQAHRRRARQHVGLAADAAGTEGATIVRFDDDATVTAAVVSGQVDGLCTPNALAAAIARQNPSKGRETKFAIKDIRYAIGIRQNEPELQRWLNAWIDTKNGRLGQIYQQWIGTPMPDLTQFAAK